MADRWKIFGYSKMDLEKKTKESNRHEACQELLLVGLTSRLNGFAAKAQSDNDI